MAGDMRVFSYCLPCFKYCDTCVVEDTEDRVYANVVWTLRVGRTQYFQVLLQ